MHPRSSLVPVLASVVSVGCSHAEPVASVEDRVRAVASSTLGGPVTLHALESDAVPGTRCFRAERSSAHLDACVSPSLGVLTGASGFASWLRARAFAIRHPTLDPARAMRAYAVFTGRDDYQPTRGFSHLGTGVWIVETDGRDATNFYARTLAIRPDGTAVEGPDALVPEDDAPTGTDIARFRDQLGDGLRSYDAFHHLRLLDAPGLTCFAAVDNHSGLLAKSVAGCVREHDVLVGEDGLQSYLLARGFHPTAPGLEPEKLASVATMFTGAWDEYRFGHAESAVERVTGALVMVLPASYRDPSVHLELIRVLRIDLDATVHEGWKLDARDVVHEGPPPRPGSLSRDS